jgi:regulation of enolase protein 1 (concanavalin A-like superfamily)
MTPRLRFLLALAPMIVVSAAPPRGGGEVQVEPAARESFNGKFRLKWQVVRPDVTHYSLTKNRGRLTLTTQRGTIHKKQQSDEDKIKNVFLIANPYGREGDFEVTVCVSDFEPTARYHQAGLILYDDDDNYLKFVWESRGEKGDTHLVFLRETAAESDILRAATPDNKGKVWLRLTKRKQKYEYASGIDGKTWAIHGGAEWGEKGPGRIGLTASNGPTDVPEIDACFTAFRVRPAPPQTPPE